MSTSETTALDNQLNAEIDALTTATSAFGFDTDTTLSEKDVLSDINKHYSTFCDGTLTTAELVSLAFNPTTDSGFRADAQYLLDNPDVLEALAKNRTATRLSLANSLKVILQQHFKI